MRTLVLLINIAPTHIAASANKSNAGCNPGADGRAFDGPVDSVWVGEMLLTHAAAY